MISVPVALLEFDPNGNTIWIHNSQGATVLRIKSRSGFVVDGDCENICSHSDIIVDGPVRMCLADDAQGVENVGS